MTTNPPNLLAVRALVRQCTGLPAVAVGIAGDTEHVEQGNSYHLGLPEQERTGYAATESARDKAGLSQYASALDIGMWSKRPGGKAHDLRSMSLWLVAQCKAGAPDTRDIREIIYSPDGKVVRRWDRLNRRSSGDDSHLSHTHVSYFRDATKAGRDLTPLYRRYFTEIGLLAGEDDDMEQTDKLIRPVPGDPAKDVGWLLNDLALGHSTLFLSPDKPQAAALRPEPGSVLDVLLKAAERSAVELTDADRAAIADQVADIVADRVADKLAARLAD